MWNELEAAARPGATGAPDRSRAAADLLAEIWWEVADWQCAQAARGRARPVAVPPPAPAALPEPTPPPVAACCAEGGAVGEAQAFIIAAYQSLLGRSPDQTGLANLQVQLASGRSKADILRGIEMSPEAKQRRARLRRQRLAKPFLAPFGIALFGRRSATARLS